MTPSEPLGGPVGPAPGAPGDAPNVLRHYVAVLRRRWRWIALGVIVGLLGGYASTLLQDEVRDPTRYYKATHTLILNQFDPTSQTGSVPNLQQGAFLVQSSEVTDAVAGELGIDPQTVRNQVSGVARTDVLAIDVTGISTDPNEAVALADDAAQVLNDQLDAQSQDQFQAELDEVTGQIDDYKQQVEDLDRDIDELPLDKRDILQATRDSVYNQYRLALERLQILAQQGEPTGPLSTLQTASAIEINGAAYNKRLQDNINSRGSLSSGVVAQPGDDANETAIGSSAPVSKSTRVAIGGVTGLVLGLVAAFLIEAWDDRLRRRDRVERVTALPVIAEVPVLPKSQRHNTDVPAVDAPRSRAAERYRAVRTSLLFVLQDHTGVAPIGSLAPLGGAMAKTAERRTPVVMVTSPNPGEGKTTTVANVAAVFGDSDIRTLVVDCDYRKPSAGKYLAPVPSAEHPDAPQGTRLTNVWFLPAPRNSDSWGQILTQLRRDIDRWRDDYDIVLLDTPPMLATNDASDLLAVADNVVLVLRAGMTRSGPAEMVSNLLGRFKADVLGVVLNACSATEMDYGGYGYYGRRSGYYVDDSAKPSRSATKNGSTENGVNGNGHTNGNGSGGRVTGPVPDVEQPTRDQR